MKTQIMAGLLATSMTLSGCSMLDLKSLEVDNLIKTAAVTTVAYVSGGTIPALAVAATAITVDEILPEENSINEIEAGNKEQMTAFIVANITDNIVYTFFGSLAFFFIIVPWFASRRTKRKMTDQYYRKKYDKMKEELKVRRKDDNI